MGDQRTLEEAICEIETKDKMIQTLNKRLVRALKEIARLLSEQFERKVK